MSWRDAQLTAEGEQQAREAHDFWLSQFEHEHIPHPQSYYVSPLDRCLATGHITFSTLPLPAPHPYRPVVKEVSHAQPVFCTLL